MSLYCFRLWLLSHWSLAICEADEGNFDAQHHLISPQARSTVHTCARTKPVGSQEKLLVVCRTCTNGWGCHQMSGHSCQQTAFGAPSPGRCWPSSWTRACCTSRLPCTTCQRTPPRTSKGSACCGSMSGTGKLKASNIYVIGSCTLDAARWDASCN